MRHFLGLETLDHDTLHSILMLSHKLKQKPPKKILEDLTLAMVFEAPSTRTRVSFDVAMRKLGGNVITLHVGEMQLGRGESIADTARALGCYVDVLMLRTGREPHLMGLAKHSPIPVINGLTDLSHPCQIMADLLTVYEKWGTLEGKRIAWVGDCNNVADSWIHAATHLGMEFSVGAPEKLQPSKWLREWVKRNDGTLDITDDPTEAVKDADCVITDAWVSMHHENVAEQRALLRDYQVNDILMAQAKDEAVFMHCLPAHRGEEVTDEVLDGPASLIWEEAKNRLFASQAIILWCLEKEQEV